MTTTATTTHHLTADQFEDALGGGTWMSARHLDIIVNGRKHHIGYSPAGVGARQVFQGPLVTDLFGSLMEQPVIIATWHPTPDPRIEASIGDHFAIEGVGEFVLVATRFDGLRLDVVA